MSTTTGKNQKWYNHFEQLCLQCWSVMRNISVLHVNYKLWDQNARAIGGQNRDSVMYALSVLSIFYQ